MLNPAQWLLSSSTLCDDQDNDTMQFIIIIIIFYIFSSDTLKVCVIDVCVSKSVEYFFKIDAML